MAMEYYTSGTAKIGVDTVTNKISIEDTASEDGSWTTPIVDPDDVDEIDGLMVPGFAYGKILMIIAKKINKLIT